MSNKAAGIALGAGALTATGVAFYGAQIPTAQIYGRTICREPGAGRKLCLTYDDGPNPAWTPALLDLLDEHDAKATFFLIGKWSEREPELIREVVSRGHAIGNHTFTHPTMPAKSDERIRQELDACREAVEAAGVSFSEVAGRMLMRPPYGRRRPGTLRVLKEKGYIGVTWSITCYDWRPHTTARAITHKGLKAGEGDIILLHDGFDQDPAFDRHKSIEATRNLLEHYRPQGFDFVTVPELVAAAGTESRYAA
ncbi:MAG: peptidoglycan-N-acetylglucosamine deacetylase [Actinomycetota bacterium]|jgi:peptidoglycan/xylan/chitin deacetylase (PgdA/CDA1 family)|nr:peptidoglycan-N-acetylglucosamine deacetylase [Actinomycetota bacterium]